MIRKLLSSAVVATALVTVPVAAQAAPVTSGASLSVASTSLAQNTPVTAGASLSVAGVSTIQTKENGKNDGGSLLGIGNIITGSQNPLAQFGHFFKHLHHSVENVISSMGLSDLVEEFDFTFVHPILWDPISKITGVDVSSHPGM